LWKTTVGQRSHGYGPRLACDSLNNVFVADMCYTDTGCLAKITESGDVQWSQEFFLDNADYNEVLVSVGSDGQPVIAMDNWDRMTIAKYSADGNSIWEDEQYNEVAAGCPVYDLKPAQAGNTYLTGGFCLDSGYCTEEEQVTVNYDSDGSIIWMADIFAFADSSKSFSAQESVSTFYGGISSIGFGPYADGPPPDDDTLLDDDTTPDDDTTDDDVDDDIDDDLVDDDYTNSDDDSTPDDDSSSSDDDSSSACGC